VTELEGYVDVAGGRLWAQAAGEGSGVVLVHAGIADARMWDPQWDALAARHRVVRYDTRGFGRSESTQDAVFSNRADLVAVMGAAGLEQATLVGCSRAGSIVDLQLWVDGVGQPAGRAPAAMRAFVRRMMIDTWIREPAYGQPVVLDPPAAGRLGSIRCPTLAIVGELDPSGTGQAADALVAGVHGSRRIDLSGVAHLPSLERPAWFTETLLAFLAEVG
jgi:pimeloyl-ACP methyl ester carboxylesterase